MKLLYITNGITGAGGLERVLSVKATMLAEDCGYEVHILSLNEENLKPFYTFSPKIIFHSIKANGNPIIYLLNYKNGISKYISTIKPDVISVCDDALKGFFLPILIPSKSKWIHESHASYLLGNKGSGIGFKKKTAHQLKQILGKKFTKIVILTEGHREEWQIKNLMVIPNPAPFKSFQKSSLQNRKIIAVGSFSFNKGYDLLLKIWAKIEPVFPDWQLNIYGKNTFQNLQKEAEKLNLKNINFNDPVVNIEEKYLEASIFVLPSRSEGFGMVLIEAMSFGLPVVSFNCPHGPKDIIENNADGFLVENGNIQEFAEKLKLLIEDETLRHKMGENGGENVKRFSPENVLKIWNELFKNLIKK